MPQLPSQPGSAQAPTSPGDGIYRLAELAYNRLDGFDRSRTVVIFAVSPLEEHGTHLPVGTDLFEAEFFSQELAKRIVDRMPGWSVLLAPSLPIGAWAFEHTGTLRVRTRTVRRAAQDYGAALARHGFKYILLMNAHAGPGHIVALEEAATLVSWRHRVRMFSLSGPILWNFLRGKYTDRLETLIGRPLTPEERQAARGDAHGGLWETSLLLRARPELVNAEYATLPPQRFSLLKALVPNYPLRLGNRKGYIGSPAAANASWGETARKLLLDVAWELVCPVLDGTNQRWQRRSVLYKLPVMRARLPYALAAGALALGTLSVAAIGGGALLWRLARRHRP